MANVNIQEDGVNLAEANTLNFNTPLLASVNTSTGVANIEASAIKITELSSAEQAVGQDLFVIVKNAFSFPVTENILVSDVFKNVSVNTTFNANVTSSSNLNITNNSVVTIGNSSQNTVLSYNYIAVKNSVSNSANIEPGRIAVGNVVINASHISVGSNLSVNVTTFTVGNTSANATLRGNSLRIENTTQFTNVAAGSISVGNSSSNLVIDVDTLTNPSEEKSSAGNYYLNANGDWAVVEAGISNPGGSNTNIQYNNSNTLSGSNAFNFDNTTNTVSIQNNLNVGNSTSNVFANATALNVSNSTSNVSISPNRITVGNTVVNSSLITISNSTSTANINPSSVRIADVIVNSSSVSVGSNAIQNSTGFNVIGSATEGNSVVNSAAFYIGNSVIATAVTRAGFTTGTSTSNTVINSSAVAISNSTANINLTIPTTTQISNGNFYLNANGSWSLVSATPSTTPAGSNTQLQFNNSGAFGASGGLTFNSTTNTLNIANSVFLGNTTSNVFANNTVLKVGNAISNVLTNSSSIVLANSTSNTRIAIPPAATRAGAAFFLHANGEWVNVSSVVSATPGGSNTQLQFNDSSTFNGSAGLTFDKLSNNLSVSNTVSVGNSTVNSSVNTSLIRVANSTTSVNISSVQLTIGNTVVNTTNINLGANVTINSSTINVGSNVSMNLTAIDVGSVLLNTSTISISTDFSVNSSVLALGSNIVANTTSVLIGNATVNTVANSSALKLANSTVSTGIKLPTAGQYSSTNHVLHANGEWVTITTGEATAGGSNTNIQYNNSGVISGSNAFNFDNTTNTISISNTLTVANTVVNNFGVYVSNTTSNSRFTIPTVAQYSGNAFFLHANGSWINVETVITTTGIGSPGGANTNIQFNDSGVLSGVSAFSFNKVSNTVLLANSTSNTKLTIPTVAQYSGNAFFLHANGNWVNVETVITTTGIGAPGGSNTNIQFNDSGVLSGVSAFSFDKVSNTVSLANSTSNTRLTIPTVSQWTSGQFVLNANGSWSNVVSILAAANVTGPGGSNTQLQFNDSGILNATAGFIFNKLSNNVTLANTLFVSVSDANVVVNSSIIRIANTTSAANIQPTQILIGGNVVVNTSTFYSGNSTVNSSSNSSKLSFNTSLGTANLESTQLVIGNSSVNTTAVHVGDATVNTFANSSLVKVANSTGSANLEATRLTIGTSLVNTTVFAAGSNVIANTTSIFVGNATVNTVLSQALLRFANSTTNTGISLPDSVQYGGAAFFLHANGNWVNVETVITTTGIGSPGGSNTQIQYNNSGVLGGALGFTFNNTTNNVTMSNTLSIGTGSPVVISNNRIRGDFSTGSYAAPSGFAQRVTFQSSTLAQTQVQAMPGSNSHSQRQSSFIAYNGDPSNSSFIATAAIPEYTFIESGRTGTGTYLPMYVWTDASPRYVFTNNNIFGVGGASDRGGIVSLKYKNVGLYPFNGNQTWNMDVYGYGTSQNHFRIINYDSSGNPHLSMICSEPSGASLTPANTIFAPRSASVAQIPFHLCVEGDFGPYADNAYDIGSSARAWRNIYSENAVTVTSDIRYKSDIVDSNLGLNFINNLRPVSYTKKEEVKELVTKTLEDGTTENSYVSNETAPKTTHYGLIAQEVKSVMDNMRIDNFGGWVISDEADEDSKQLLRYEEFISPMIKAIQELSKEVVALKEKIKKLENE